MADGRSATLMLGEKRGLPDHYIRGKKQDQDPAFGGFNDAWASYSSAWPRTYTAAGTQDSWTKGPCVVNCRTATAGSTAFISAAPTFCSPMAVRNFLSEKLSVEVFLALLTRSGGENLAPQDIPVVPE